MTEKEFDETTLWTPANVVTLIRILLVPVFVVAIISPWPDFFPEWESAELWKPWIAALIFAILSCTDALDGYLARSRGEVTNFGKFIDPLADKILVAAALLALIELQVLPSWVALLIIAREFIVSGLRMLVATHGVVVAASWYGKAKTVFQIIAILLFIVKESDLLLALHPDMELGLYVVSWFFMIVALILTIVSMVDYFMKCAPILGFGNAGAKNKDEAECKAPMGTYISFDTPYVEYGDGFACGKAFDDRVGCLSLLRLLQEELPVDLVACFVSEEEVGCRGAKGAAFQQEPDVGIVLEGTTCNDLGDVPETAHVCEAGQGVAVSFMDGASIANRALFRKALDVAKQENIPHQVKHSVSGGNDGGAIQRAREGVPVVVLSVPCRYIHSPSSVVKLSDVESQFALVKALVKAL